MNNTNENISKSKIKFDKVVFLYAYVFLFVPVLLFFIFWTKFYIGITLSVIGCIGFYFILKAKREYKDFLGKDYKKKLIMIAILALIWTFLSGQGGLFFQNADYNMRNAIFNDLVKFNWPVIYNIPNDISQTVMQGSNAYETAIYFEGNQATICYYLGFWLPPAFLGKGFYLLFGNFGLALSQFFLFAWTFSGVFTVLYLFARAFKKFSYKIILIFIFFSGMDIIASLFFYVTGLEGMLFPEGRLIPHLDTWTMQQYTSNTSALFWVFNQVIPLWLFCCILLNEKDLKYIFFPYSCLVINSTLPMIGALPLIFFFIINKLKTNLLKKGEKITFKALFNEVKRFLNVTNFSAIPILVISYLYVASSPATASFSFMSGSPDLIKLLLILGSLLFEIALLIFVLFNAKIKEKSGLLISISILLFIIPFFNIGPKYDFTMRASLPALFFLCYLCCYAICNITKKQIIRLLAIVLIIGSFTAGAEMLQPIVYSFTGQNPKANNIETLADITNTHFEAKNCLGKLDGFFMKYILKK